MQYCVPYCDPWGERDMLGVLDTVLKIDPVFDPIMDPGIDPEMDPESDSDPSLGPGPGTGTLGIPFPIALEGVE